MKRISPTILLKKPLHDWRRNEGCEAWLPYNLKSKEDNEAICEASWISWVSRTNEKSTSLPPRRIKALKGKKSTTSTHSLTDVTSKSSFLSHVNRKKSSWNSCPLCRSCEEAPTLESLLIWKDSLPRRIIASLTGTLPLLRSSKPAADKSG